MMMKPRHAAALALLAACAGPSVKTAQSTGWKIMQPPQIEGKPWGTLDETAPLSKLVVAPADIDVYPSQNECEQILENWLEGVRREGFPQAAKVDEMSRCVSINDPHLKEIRTLDSKYLGHSLGDRTVPEIRGGCDSRPRALAVNKIGDRESTDQKRNVHKVGLVSSIAFA
jgi:hypothetical protein